MGFRAIESDEEFEAALTGGLLWLHLSGPRHQPVRAQETNRWRWQMAKNCALTGRAGWRPEDFLVYVEE